MLKLAPQHTIVDAVGSLDRLDAALLAEPARARTSRPGCWSCRPRSSRPSPTRSAPPRWCSIVELLRTFCAYVVIDTPAYFNDVVLGLIEESDDVLLVAGMDIPNIKNVKIGLQTLRLLNTPMAKLHLVLNRANSKVKLDVSEVERTLQIKAESLDPERRRRARSRSTRATPVVLDAPKSGVAKAIEQLADMFVADDAESSTALSSELKGRRMSLYKRLHEVQQAPTAARRRKRRDPVLDELRQKIHHHLIDELGPILYDKRLSEDDLRRRVHEQLHAALAQERAPLSAADKAQLIQDVSDDILGYGPIDRLLKDEEVTEVMVNGPDSRSTSSAAASSSRPTPASSTRPTSGASSTRS